MATETTIDDDLLLRHVRLHLSLVTEQIVGEVERTEIEGEFPFDRLNDLRAYMNYAPHYFRAFLDVFEESSHQGVRRDLLARALGTSTRFRRYFVLLVMGAYLSETLSTEQRLRLLRELVTLAYERPRQHTLPSGALEDIAEFARAKRAILWKPRAAAAVGVKLRQFVDLLFLGEHPLAYQAFLTIESEGPRALVRHFWRLGEGTFLDGPQRVSMIYTLKPDKAPPRIDLYNGEAVPIPTQIEGFDVRVLVDGVPAGDQMGAQLGLEVENAIAACSETQADSSASQLEVRKMELFSSEVTAIGLLTRRRCSLTREAVQAIQASEGADLLKSELQARTYTEAYFRLLRRSMEWVALASEADKR